MTRESNNGNADDKNHYRELIIKAELSTSPGTNGGDITEGKWNQGRWQKGRAQRKRPKEKMKKKIEKKKKAQMLRRLVIKHGHESKENTCRRFKSVVHEAGSLSKDHSGASLFLWLRFDVVGEPGLQVEPMRVSDCLVRSRRWDGNGEHLPNPQKYQCHPLQHWVQRTTACPSAWSTGVAG